VWGKIVFGEEKYLLWVGATGEVERVISQALTKALNNAVKEFSSEEFYKAIRK